MRVDFSCFLCHSSNTTITSHIYYHMLPHPLYAADIANFTSTIYLAYLFHTSASRLKVCSQVYSQVYSI